MRRATALRWRSSLAFLAALSSAACLSTSPPPATSERVPSATSSADTDDRTVTTTLVYQRPAIYSSAERPGGFELIRDYRNQAATEEILGNWNDETQTLTAPISVGLRVENLVYVIDGAVTPEAETPLSATRAGALHEVVCPSGVHPEHACYLLQVLR